MGQYDMKVFISYRHADSTYLIGRIKDRLIAEFRDQSVFCNPNDIPAGDAKTIDLWNVPNIENISQPYTFKRHNGTVLASAGFDNRIILWDTSTGEQISPPLNGQTKAVNQVAFGPYSSKWEQKACQAAKRNLTTVEWDQYLPNLPHEKTCEEYPLQDQ
jgi:hypothetical protein